MRRVGRTERTACGIAALLACACGAGGAVDASQPDADLLPMPESHTYVIGALHASTGDPQTAFGFDLDADARAVPGTCTDAPDFVDPFDPTNEDVDNQIMSLGSALESVVPDGLEGLLRDQIEQGAVLVVLSVEGIDSYAEDPSVTVHAVMGAAADAALCAANTTMAACAGNPSCAWLPGAGARVGAPPPGGCSSVAASPACAAHLDAASCLSEVDAACSWSTAIDACSGIAAGQSFTGTTDLGVAAGEIHGGRLTFAIDLLPLQIHNAGSDYPLHLQSTRFSTRIAANALTDGELGGVLPVIELASHTMFCPGALDCSERGLAAMWGADQLPVPDTTATCPAHTTETSCATDPTYCGWDGRACRGVLAYSFCRGLSAGFGFEAVAATLR